MCGNKQLVVHKKQALVMVEVFDPKIRRRQLSPKLAL